LTEEKGGGLGRSEKGVFGEEKQDWPAEEKVGRVEKVPEEETGEVPAKE
jgi:hypothetical protein